MKLFYLCYNDLHKYVTVDNGSDEINVICVIKPAAKFFGIDTSRYKLYLCDERNVELNEDTFQVFVGDCLLTYDKLFILRVVQNNERFRSVTTQTEEDITLGYAAPLEKSNCFIGSIPKRQKLQVSVLQLELRKYLQDHAEGKRILEVYNTNKTLQKTLRTKLINIIIGHLIEIHGTYPSTENKILWAKATACNFLRLCENHDPDNFGIFYNPITRSGFFAFRLRTINRSLCNNSRISNKENDHSITSQYTEEVYMQDLQTAVQKLKELCPKNDQSEIFDLMKKTICLRRTPFTYDMFPRYLDTPGLISFEFDVRYPGKCADFIELWQKVKYNILRLGQERKIVVYGENTADDEKYDSDITAFLILSKLSKTVGRRKGQKDPHKTSTPIAFRKTGTTLTWNEYYSHLIASNRNKQK